MRRNGWALETNRQQRRGRECSFFRIRFAIRMCRRRIAKLPNVCCGSGGTAAQRRAHRGALPGQHRARDRDRGLHADSSRLEARSSSECGRRDARLFRARYRRTARVDHGLRGRAVTGPVVDLSFPHQWEAEILAARPLILPPRHFVYPREAEEVERGALEVLVRPGGEGARALSGDMRAGLSRPGGAHRPVVCSQSLKKSAPSPEAMPTSSTPPRRSASR